MIFYVYLSCNVPKSPQSFLMILGSALWLLSIVSFDTAPPQPTPYDGLPVVSGNLFFHLGDEITFGTRVFLAFLDSRLPVRSLQVIGFLFDLRCLGLVGALVVEKEHIHVGGGEGALVALVFDSRASGCPRRQVQKQECTVGTITFSTSKRVSNFSKVLFWAAKASGTEGTVFNGAFMNVMELLIVTEERPHYNDVGAVAFGVSKITELTIIARYHIILCSLAGEVLLFSPTRALVCLGHRLPFCTFG